MSGGREGEGERGMPRDKGLPIINRSGKGQVNEGVLVLSNTFSLTYLLSQVMPCDPHPFPAVVLS